MHLLVLREMTEQERHYIIYRKIEAYLTIRMIIFNRYLHDG